jgi:hypothetical protein
MKKALLTAALLALVLALASEAPAAFGALGHQCAASPCTGTKSANHLYERGGNGRPDAIYGRGGRDRLDASYWGRDRDHLYGNNGRDTLNARDGDARDVVSGGPGFDTCITDTAREIGPGCDRTRFYWPGLRSDAVLSGSSRDI